MFCNYKIPELQKLQVCGKDNLNQQINSPQILSTTKRTIKEIARKNIPQKTWLSKSLFLIDLH